MASKKKKYVLRNADWYRYEKKAIPPKEYIEDLEGGRSIQEHKYGKKRRIYKTNYAPLGRPPSAFAESKKYYNKLKKESTMLGKAEKIKVLAKDKKGNVRRMHPTTTAIAMMDKKAYGSNAKKDRVNPYLMDMASLNIIRTPYGKFMSGGGEGYAPKQRTPYKDARKKNSIELANRLQYSTKPAKKKATRKAKAKPKMAIEFPAPAPRQMKRVYSDPRRVDSNMLLGIIREGDINTYRPAPVKMKATPKKKKGTTSKKKSPKMTVYSPRERRLIEEYQMEQARAYARDGDMRIIDADIEDYGIKDYDKNINRKGNAKRVLAQRKAKLRELRMFESEYL